MQVGTGGIVINNEKQAEDKLAQLEESIDQVMYQLNSHIDNSSLFTEACDKPNQYRVIGVVIAPAGIRGISRNKYSKRIRKDNYNAFLTMMPPERLKECQITWGQLLRSIVEDN